MSHMADANTLFITSQFVAQHGADTTTLPFAQAGDVVASVEYLYTVNATSNAIAGWNNFDVTQQFGSYIPYNGVIYIVNTNIVQNTYFGVFQATLQRG